MQIVNKIKNCHGIYRFLKNVPVLLKKTTPKQVKRKPKGSNYTTIIKHEGYYANVTRDKGRETYMGVSRSLHPNCEGWSIIDLYKPEVGSIKHNTKINIEGLTFLVKEFYRHTFPQTYRIESIKNGVLQEIIFEGCANSGYWGNCVVQKVLNRFFDCGLKLGGTIGNHLPNPIPVP